MADERTGSWRSATKPGRAGRAFDRDTIRCSFCGKRYADVQTIVCGPTPSVAICNECVDLCGEIISEQCGDPNAGR